MKKLVSMVLALTFVVSLGFVSAAMAGDTKAKGTVVSVNKDEATLVFCPEGTKDEVSVKADDPKQLAGLDKGDSVKIEYDADAGTASKIKKQRKITVPVGC